MGDDNKNSPPKREIRDVYSKLNKIVSHLPQSNVSLDPIPGMSLLQKTQLAINQISEVLSGMRVLAEKTASGILGSSELGNTIEEYQALHREIDHIAHNTSYNNIQLLNGSLGSVSIVNESLELEIQMQNFTTQALGLKSNDLDSRNTNDAQNTLHAIKKVIETVHTTLNSLDNDEIIIEKLIHNPKEEMDLMVDMMRTLETSNRAKFIILDMSKLALLSHKVSREFVLEVLKQR